MPYFVRVHPQCVTWNRDEWGWPYLEIRGVLSEEPCGVLEEEMNVELYEMCLQFDRDLEGDTFEKLLGVLGELHRVKIADCAWDVLSIPLILWHAERKFWKAR